MFTPMVLRPLFTGVFAVILLAAGLSACSEGGGVNLFTIEDDKALGAQIAAEIAADQAQFPVLDSAAYPKVYAPLYALRDVILGSGEVVHAQDFNWQIRVVHNDTIVNAFCTPGGYIYVYTGLIRYLDNMSQLAGVLAHEMAHADLRHSTDQLTNAYGISFLLNLILGENQGVVSDVAANLTQLAFSRSDESQADAYAVRYLCSTEYDPTGAAGFFTKVQEESDVQVLEFFSTHPSPSNRVDDIHRVASKLQCGGAMTDESSYQRLKNALPAAQN